MKDQTKTRTTLLDCFIGLKNAFKDVGTMFTNNEETTITSVDDIPGLETYTSEEDIKLIKRMESMREKIHAANTRIEKRKETPTIKSKSIKSKVVQREQETERIR